MSVLFFSSDNNINEQEKLLMQSLLKNSYPLIYACPENSPLATMANSSNIPFIEIPKSSIAQYSRVRSYLKKHKVTTIHALDKNAFKIARYLKMTLKQPLDLAVSHHTPIDYNAPNLFKDSSTYAIQAFLSKKAQILFVSSFELFNTLQSKKGPNSKLEFLPYAIDMDEVFPLETTPQYLIKHDPSKRFIFLIDTLLEKDKGFELLFEALSDFKQRLTEDDPIVEVHICGSGSLFNEFIDKIHELDIASMLAFFGNNDTQIFYKNSHAMICPSSAGEGDYRTILNGWRASLPVICSDISAHTKLVVSGRSKQSALMFPRDCAQTLTQCMLEVIRNKAEYNSLIATGKNMTQLSRYENLETKYAKTLKHL